MTHVGWGLWLCTHGWHVCTHTLVLKRCTFDFLHLSFFHSYVWWCVWLWVSCTDVVADAPSASRCW